jgi:hypothetical protein
VETRLKQAGAAARREMIQQIPQPRTSVHATSFFWIQIAPTDGGGIF